MPKPSPQDQQMSMMVWAVGSRRLQGGYKRSGAFVRTCGSVPVRVRVSMRVRVRARARARARACARWGF